MADRKISELTNITGANLADGDELVVVDASASETKAITFGEFKNALDTATGFVSITGDTMTGDLALSGADITFGDNDKAIFGAGSDLQIYHDGSKSYINDQGTGEIVMRTNRFVIQDVTGTETIARFDQNSFGKLYYDDAQKLATTSTGIDVTGTVTADGLTVESNNNSTGAVATLSNTNVSTDGNTVIGALVFDNNDDSANATDAEIRAMSDSTAGRTDLYIRTGDAGTLNDRLKVRFNGDISFYEDTGTTAKFFWDASAESLGIGTTSPTTALDVNTLSGGSQLRISNGTYYGYFGIDSAYAGLDYAAPSGGHRFRVGGSFTEAMRIDSSGNVGIGTTSPTHRLDVLNDGGEQLRLLAWDQSSSARANIDFWYLDGGGTPYNNAQISTLAAANAGNGNLVFSTRPTSGSLTERMRIDSSGNLLVGTTSNAPTTTAGINLGSNNKLHATRSSGTSAYFNRLTSDGGIVEFAKDGTTVGSIGASGGDIIVGTGTSRLRFYDATPAILPSSSETFGASDGAIDLGNDGRRFKDLYLSGGVYLGGTGAANKLDDYESGSFTPSWGGSATAGTASGTFLGVYTKIGRVVYCTITLSGCNLTGASGALQLTGLPFSAASGNLKSGGTAYLEGVTPSFSYTPQTGSHVQVYVAGSSTTAQFRVGLSAQWDNYLNAASTFTSGGGSTYGTVSITYTT